MDRLPQSQQQHHSQQQQQWEALTPTQQEELVRQQQPHQVQQPPFSNMFAPGIVLGGRIDNGQVQHFLPQQQHPQHLIQQQLLQQQQHRQHELIQRQQRPQQLSPNQALQQHQQQVQFQVHQAQQHDGNALPQFTFVAPAGDAYVIAGGNAVNVGVQSSPLATMPTTTGTAPQMVVIPQSVTPGVGSQVLPQPTPQYSAEMVSNLIMATTPAPLAPAVDSATHRHLPEQRTPRLDPRGAVPPQRNVEQRQQVQQGTCAPSSQVAQGLLRDQLQRASARTHPGGNISHVNGGAVGRDAKADVEGADQQRPSTAAGIPGLTPSMADIMAEVLKNRGVQLDSPAERNKDDHTTAEVEVVGVTPAPPTSLFSYQSSDGADGEDDAPNMDEPLLPSDHFAPSTQMPLLKESITASRDQQPSSNPRIPPFAGTGGAFARPQGVGIRDGVGFQSVAGNHRHPTILESNDDMMSQSSVSVTTTSVDDDAAGGSAQRGTGSHTIGVQPHLPSLQKQNPHDERVGHSLTAEQHQKLLLLQQLHITRAKHESAQQTNLDDTSTSMVHANPRLPDVVSPITHSSAIVNSTTQQLKEESHETKSSDKQSSMVVERNFGAESEEGNDQTEIDETNKAQHREYALNRLRKALSFGIRIAVINLSQRGLTADDAETLGAAVAQCPQLTVLRLSYNQFGDQGAAILADAIGSTKDCDAPLLLHQHGGIRQRKGSHHPNLEILDLGFNRVGDAGCSALARAVVGGNFVLRTLYLSGNTVGMGGGAALADAIEKDGSGLERLHLTANKIGSHGIQLLLRAIAQNDQKVISSGRSTSDTSPVPMMMSTAMDFKNAPDSGCKPTGLPPSIHEQSRVFARSSSNDGGHRAMRELFLGGTNMGSAGCLAVSNMVLTSTSLRVLSLCDNGLQDQDLALLSHALHQALKRRTAPPVPLETLELSFNELTCVGVESLMNAVWGSPDLRELRLDNNNVRDRGAQLAALTLATLKNLQVLDVGFNVISSEGIRALMKSLTEDGSLKSLSLSGNALDVNSCKAISYALAHNTSLSAFYVDNCSMGYAAQRHVTAGIVSNSSSALRVVTGIRIGAIASTLGLPSDLIGWSNERVLNFFRMMWERQRERSDDGGMETDAPSRHVARPSDPASVVAAAKSMMVVLDDDSSVLDATEDEYPNVREISKTSPYVPDDALILEREPVRGKLSVPVFGDEPVTDPDPLHINKKVAHSRSGRRSSLDYKVGPASTGKKRKKPRSGSSPDEEEPVPSPPVLSPRRVARNLEWLKRNVSALSEVSKFPFNEAELWKLEQFYSSPPEGSGNSADSSDDQPGSRMESVNADSGREVVHRDGTPSPGSSTSSLSSSGGVITRKLSFRFLGDSTVPMAAEAAAAVAAPPVAAPTTVGPDGRRRRLVPINESDSSVEDLAAAVENSAREGEERVTKRRRSPRNRIAFYPRIKQKLQLMKLRSEPYQALVLLRRLRYVETIMFRDRNIYAEVVNGEGGDAQRSSNSSSRSRGSGVEFDISESMEEGGGELPTTVDVEAILLDML